MMRQRSSTLRGLLFALALTLVAAPACQDEAPTTVDEGAAPAPAAPAAVAQPAFELPSEVLAVTGIPSLEAFLATVNEVANTVAPGSLPPNLASMALESMKADMGLSDISWFRSDAPVLVAVVDSKTFEGKNQVMLVPTSDPEKALASLKEGAQRDFEGHTAFYEHRFEKVYVDMIEGYVVFTDHTRIFPAVKDFVSKELRLWKPDHAISIRLAMDHVVARYGAEIAQGKEMVREMAKEVSAGEAAFDTSEVQELQLALLFSMVESANRIGIDLSAKGSDLRLGLSVDAKAGSDLATFLTLIAGKESSMIGALPSGSWAAFGGHMDVRKFAPLRKIQEASLGAYVNILSLDAKESASLATMISALADQSSGDSLTSFYADGAFPFAFVSAQAVDDLGALRATLGKLLPFLLDHGYSALSRSMEADGQKLPPAKVTSMADLVGLAKPFCAAYGVTPTVSERDQDGVHVDALDFAIDWVVLSRELGLAAQEVETVKMLQTVVGSSVQLAFATGGNRSVTALGPHAVDHALAMAKGAAGPGDPAFAALAKGQNMAMSFRIGALLRALSFIPDLSAMKPLIDGIAPNRALTLQVDSAGDAASMVMGIPIDVIRDMVGMVAGPQPQRPVPAPRRPAPAP
jgi:hypothetical protein